MRLLLLTPEFDRAGGGIATFYRALAPALRAAGMEVRVIEGSAFHAAKDRDRRAVLGCEVETLELDRLFRWRDRFPARAATPSLRGHLAAAWAMWEQAGFAEGADIVEACDWGLQFVPPALDAVRPVIVQGHGSAGQISEHDPVAGEETGAALTRLIERAVLQAPAARAQTYSGANGAFWRSEAGCGVTVIRPAWAPPEGWAAGRAPGGTSGQGLVAGRVQRWKGPHILCAALERLGSRAPVVQWIGRDTAWGSRDKSAAAHLARTFAGVWGVKVVHHAPVSPAEVAQRQASALFNLVPSTWDVFNFTAVEAMASGRPAIVSTGAGASELIEDGENGFLFAAGDAEALADALDRVLGMSRERLAGIGAAAQATVRAALDPETIVNERLAAYRAAIEDFHERPPPPVTGWLAGVCRPAAPPNETGKKNEMAFLEHLPARAIASHLVTRVSRRVSPR